MIMVFLYEYTHVFLLLLKNKSKHFSKKSCENFLL